MYRIFVSGPITPCGTLGKHIALEYLEHTRRGIEASAKLSKLGYAVYCPFADLVYWLVLEDGPTPKNIYEGDKEFLKACHGVLALQNTTDSQNVKDEIFLAHMLGIPVFYDIFSLHRFFQFKEESKNEGGPGDQGTRDKK
jgi:hypothetical protein